MGMGATPWPFGDIDLILAQANPPLAAHRVGSRLIRSAQSGVSAWFSPDKRRRWRIEWGDAPRLTWILLNPSLAGSGAHGDNLDPTLRRVRNYSLADGCRGFTLLNLYDVVDPDPRALRDEDPADLGANAAWLREAVAEADRLVCAWGAHPRGAARAPLVLRDILRPSGTPLLALKTTKAGHPCHPLYLSKQLRPEPWAHGRATRPRKD